MDGRGDTSERTKCGKYLEDNREDDITLINTTSETRRTDTQGTSTPNKILRDIRSVDLLRSVSPYINNDTLT